MQQCATISRMILKIKSHTFILHGHTHSAHMFVRSEIQRTHTAAEQCNCTHTTHLYGELACNTVHCDMGTICGKYVCGGG